MFYAPSLRNGFAFDDVPIVETNPVVHGISTFPSSVLTAYWAQYGQLYRPVTQFSLSIDWSLGGGAPWVFHLTNVLLNAIVVALVARLALRWLPPVGAAAAAIVFAVHPVHVEAIANVVGRSELLCAAALIAIMLLATSERIVGSRRYLGIAVLAAIAVGSKETGVLAPVLAWAAAVTYGRLRRDVEQTELDGDAASRARAWSSKPAAYAALAAACGVVPLLVLRLALLGTLHGDRPHPAFSVATPWETYALALSSLVRVAGLVFAPLEPRIDYSPTLAQLANPSLVLVAIGLLILAAVIVAVVAHVRRPGVVTLAIVIAAVTFAPVSNLAFRSGLIIAERTLYSPSIGFALLAGAAVALAWRTSRAGVLAGGLLWLGPAVWIAQREIPVWESTRRVYETMRIRAPDSYKARFFAGNLRVDAGRMEAATEEYATGISLFDGDPQVLYAGGAHAMRMGDTTRALAWLGRTVERDPRNRRARGSLIRLALRQGDTTRARTLLEQGLAREPDQRIWKALLDSLVR